MYFIYGVGSLIDFVYRGIVVVWYINMALRKKLKATTSTVEPSQEYDTNRFISFVAQKRYIDLMVKKGAI